MVEQATLPQSMAVTRRSACGKAIIVGEHAVVYGAQAVAIPITSLVTELDLTVGRDRCRLTLGNLPLLSRQRLQHLKEVVFDAFKILQITPFPFEMNFRSNSLMGAGLGSSAALSVALIRLLSGWVGRQMSDSQVARLANYLELRFHGNPSGLDTAVVACRTPILFQKDRLLQKITVSKIADNYPWRFALIDSGVRAPTLAMVKKAVPYFQKQSKRLTEFSRCARQVARALALGKISPVAEAMTIVDYMLREAKITTDHLIDIIDEVKSFGVLAAKSTGAGGGGCVLALLNPKQATEQLQTIRTAYGTHNVYEVTL